MSRTTGESTPYTDEDAETLAQMLARQDDEYNQLRDAMDYPSRLYVKATIEWAGTTNPRAHRPVMFDHLAPGKVANVLEATQAAQLADQKARTASEYTSFTAKNWHAQISKLTEHRHGSAAADRAGLNVSADTLRRWLTTEQTPSRANQQRIAAAYGELRRWPVTEAKDRADAAHRHVANTITEMLRDRHGAEIRLFNVEHLDWLP